MSRPFILSVAAGVLLAIVSLVLLHRKSPMSAAERPAEERIETTRSGSGGELVLIPAGEFTMGQQNSRPDEVPHKVHVNAFYMDRYAVTQEIYEEIMGVNPAKHKDKKCPVERTQWTDAVRFCNKCSEREGLRPCYDPKTWECDFNADGYRLPTEAEWEYACRAGSTGKYFFGDDPAMLPQYAWFKLNSGGQTRPVGQKAPNVWGLYDMQGNVWEWCNDYYDENYYRGSPKENPHGPVAGKQRVLRGGSSDAVADKCTSSYRFKEFPTFADACFGADAYGFRRVKNVAEPAVGVVCDSSPNEAQNKSASGNVDPATSVGSSAKEVPAVTAAGKIDAAQLKGTIVFVSDRSGTLNIWTMDASGKNQRPLTHDSNPAADPRFSPDGKRILFTSLKAGVPEVWIMNRDGSKPYSVTQGCQGNWSPDGQSIVFIRDNQTYVRELLSGKERRVTPENWERCGVPAWSPDGKCIAVASRHMESIGIFMVGLDGKEITPLATKDPACTPWWSKDGKHLLCQTVKGHVHQVDADGKNWEQITFGADLQHFARYSPDGSMILFCRAPSQEGPWQICVMRLEGDETDFVRLTSEGSNSFPDWSE